MRTAFRFAFHSSLNLWHPRRVHPYSHKFFHPRNEIRTTMMTTSANTANDNKGEFHRHSLHDGTLRRKLRSKTPTVGVVSGFFKETEHVEILGLLGYDFLWADAEHSYAGPESIASLILAGERRGLPTLVRIGYGYQNVIGHAQKYLVAGAQGIILPQCESRDDAAKIVAAVKFPPIGERGLAGERWNAWCLGEGGSLKERVDECNENSVVGIMIENGKGIAALDDILKLKDAIDFIFIAPTDLSADMGLHGEIRHPDVLAKIEEVGEIVKAEGVAVGTLVLNGDDYNYWRDRGFQVLCGVAQCMFVDGAQSLMKTINEYESR